MSNVIPVGFEMMDKKSLLFMLRHSETISNPHISREFLVYMMMKRKMWGKKLLYMGTCINKGPIYAWDFNKMYNLNSGDFFQASLSLTIHTIEIILLFSDSLMIGPQWILIYLNIAYIS